MGFSNILISYAWVVQGLSYTACAMLEPFRESGAIYSFIKKKPAVPLEKIMSKSIGVCLVIILQGIISGRPRATTGGRGVVVGLSNSKSYHDKFYGCS